MGFFALYLAVVLCGAGGVAVDIPSAAHARSPPPLLPATAAPSFETNSWAGISNYYLWSCNATIRAEALNAVRAAGLKVLRVFLLSTEGGGAVAACGDTPTPDLEPNTVGVYDDTILERWVGNARRSTFARMFLAGVEGCFVLLWRRKAKQPRH